MVSISEGGMSEGAGGKATARGAVGLRRILLGADLLDKGDHAAARAVRLSEEAGVPLHVLTVREGGDQAVDDPAVVKAALKPQGDIDKSRIEIADGEPWQALLEQSRGLACDLIVIGPGRPTLRERIIGSTAERLAHRSRAPVLIVRQPADRAYDEIVVATDFSETARHALEVAAGLFPKAAIVLVHAFRVPFEGFIDDEAHEAEVRAAAEKACDDFLAALAPGMRERLRVEYLYGAPTDEIPQFVEERRLPLVVIGSHGATGAFDVLLGGTAEALLKALSCDVMLVREPRANPSQSA